MTDGVLVVMTGLPGSGKTALGRALATELVVPFLDKDDILETLFDHFPVEEPQDRQRLSRASDSVLATAVASCGSAVIASHWRRSELSTTSGTPTDWLRGRVVVEVHCVCPPDLAASRFLHRRRHPGHLDDGRCSDELRTQLHALAGLGPWGLGGLVEVDTSDAVDVRAVATHVRFLSVDRSR